MGLFEKFRKNNTITEQTDADQSGKVSQVTESQHCVYCLNNAKIKELSDYERMIVFITSIKSNPLVSSVSPDYLGFLIGYLRNTMCPSVTATQCEEIIHAVSHNKDIALNHLLDAQYIWDNLYHAKMQQYGSNLVDGKFLSDISNCKCTCHNDLEHLSYTNTKGCDNCTSLDTMAQDSVWHLGYENKIALFEFARKMGIKNSFGSD